MSQANLLLVDADERNRRVLEVSLRKAGFFVTTALSGADALQKLEQLEPELILSDTQLPEVDGFEFYRQLRADSRWSGIPFVFLTRGHSVEDKIRGLELGVEEYLTKPIFVKEIIVRIKTLLQRNRRDAMAQPERDGRTTFQGKLSDMGVIDLIQTMELGSKSGVLHLSSYEGQRGAIYFREGKCIDAELGLLQAEAAVYRFLTWMDGQFEVEFRTMRRKDIVDCSNQALLLEGMRRVDEWGRLQEQLPKLDTVFEVDYNELAERLGEIPDEVNAIIRLFDGRRSVMQVVDDCNFDDLEALSIIGKLYFESLIYDVACGPLSSVGPLGSVGPLNNVDPLSNASTSPEPQVEVQSPVRATESETMSAPEIPAPMLSLAEQQGAAHVDSTGAELEYEAEPAEDAAAQPSQAVLAATAPETAISVEEFGKGSSNEHLSTAQPRTDAEPQKASEADPHVPLRMRSTIPLGQTAPASLDHAPVVFPTRTPPSRAEGGLRRITLGAFGQVIPFPQKQTTGSDDLPMEASETSSSPSSTMPMGDYSGADPTERAAIAAANRAGIKDPKSASLNVHDQAFFESLYEESGADEVSQRPPVARSSSRHAMTAAAVILVLALASMAAYYVWNETEQQPSSSQAPAISLLPDAKRLREIRQDAPKHEHPVTSVEPRGTPSQLQPPPPTQGVVQRDLAHTTPPAAQGDDEGASSKPASAESPSRTEGMADADEADSEREQDSQYIDLVAQAEQALSHGQRGKAFKLFEQAVQHNPHGWEALSQLALRDLERGHLGQALAQAERAKTANPDAPYAHLVVGVVLQQSKHDIAGAKAAFERFLLLCPSCKHSADIRALLSSM